MFASPVPKMSLNAKSSSYHWSKLITPRVVNECDGGSILAHLPCPELPHWHCSWPVWWHPQGQAAAARTHRAWRQSPRCTGVARLVASLKGKVRQYNNNDTTGDSRTADCHKHAPSPCDSDSNSLLIVSCVWTLVSMMVTWCLQQVQSHCRVRSVEWCRDHAAMFVLSVLCTPAAQCQWPVTTCVMWRPIPHAVVFCCKLVYAVYRQCCGVMFAQCYEAPGVFTPSLTRTLDTMFIITLSIWSLNVEQWSSRPIHYPRMCKVSTFYLSF